MRMHPVNPRNPVIYDALGEPRHVQITSEESPTVDELVSSTFKSSQFKLDVMAQLGFKDLVKGKVDASYSFYLFEISTVDPKTRISTDEDLTLATHWGTSIRIGISVKNTSATLSMNLSQLSASATVSGTSTTVEAIFEGMDAQLSSQLVSFITLGAPFDASMMNNIGQMVATFQDQVKAHPEWIQPVPLSTTVMSSNAGIAYQQGISAAYALHSICRNQNLDQALSHLDKKNSTGTTEYHYGQVSQVLVRALYYQISDGDPNAKSLSTETKTRAQQIYNNTTAM